MESTNLRHAHAIFKTWISIKIGWARYPVFNLPVNFPETYIAAVILVAALVVEMELHVGGVHIHDLPVFLLHGHVTCFC